MAEFIKVDALGDACPLPVVKAKKAISELQGAGRVEVLVDNEIAVQNLTKMAQQKGYQYSAEKLEERKYRVLFTLGEVVSTPAEDAPVCTSDARTDTVVAISAAVMGDGSEELGKILLKAFVFALTQQDKLPKTILFYNGGAKLLSKAPYLSRTSGAWKPRACRYSPAAPALTSTALPINWR